MQVRMKYCDDCSNKKIYKCFAQLYAHINHLKGTILYQGIEGALIPPKAMPQNRPAPQCGSKSIFVHHR